MQASRQIKANYSSLIHLNLLLLRDHFIYVAFANPPSTSDLERL